MILKDMEGRKYCLFENCDYPAIIDDYCRVHFFGLFKKISRRKAILEQKILEKNYQELARQHSTSFLEFLFKDLSSGKNFKLAIKKKLWMRMENLWKQRMKLPIDSCLWRCFPRIKFALVLSLNLQ